ncbi:hypothetical protein BCE75_11185 [Isoptericola sp. CG 20/1183]|uniref:Uncharacterized protein n=1 Tax=Isoptericola halotolerans TaxID=300560 RepID=A0ABX5EIU0_9MICO|nr:MULTISPECIES: hypothetical protein [Isoptericola]PRZ04164.1 hypothetical protein BCE75_11185 [Isoptericola sp. CG 20/1183]PRZ10011.1 hypothetical protein BCL65_101149 [Isoptericola halotolerans]
MPAPAVPSDQPADPAAPGAVRGAPPGAGPSGRPELPRRRFTSPELVDLTTAWQLEEQTAQSPTTTHFWCDDRHGWMLRAGLERTLEPVLLPDSLGASSFYRFVDLDAAVAADLLERLPADYLATERQNDGPTIGTVLRAVVAHPDRLRAHGYVVGPGRCDERLTVEGVLVCCDHEFAVGEHHWPGCQCDELYRFVVGLGVDDAAVPPHEVTPWWGWGLREDDGPGAGPDHWYRLWWD